MRLINFIFLLVFAVPTSVCYAEEPANDKSPSLLEQASNTAQEVLMSALALTGTPYKFGGTSPETGFDCSGFVSYVFKQAANFTLPHGARAISQIGQNIPIDQLQPGDLVFFNTLKSTFSHVGIYIGDNRFVHAPSAGGGVHVVNMKEEYWAKRFNGGRRLDQATQPKVSPSVPLLAESSAE